LRTMPKKIGLSTDRFAIRTPCVAFNLLQALPRSQ
jgi:hypothetical protein